MKPLIPVLVLSAAVPAVCQTSQRSFQFFLAPTPQQSQHNWTRPRVFPFDRRVPAPGFTVQTAAPQFPQVDQQIIHRPPQGAFAEQPSRTPLAANLYPGLKVLPIETARVEPIPVYFPEFKMEPIPTTAPNARMVPVRADTIRADTIKPDEKK
jgi:hypothetical protein